MQHDWDLFTQKSIEIWKFEAKHPERLNFGLAIVFYKNMGKSEEKRYFCTKKG